MKLLFELSMPNVGSWNGKWSGEGTLYAIIRDFKKSQENKVHEILKTGYYHYNFGDGWSAGITVSLISGAAITKIKRKSQGFCGYDWMVDSIINYGEIINRKQQSKRRAER